MEHDIDNMHAATGLHVVAAEKSQRGAWSSTGALILYRLVTTQDCIAPRASDHLNTHHRCVWNQQIKAPEDDSGAFLRSGRFAIARTGGTG
jgi:hypothetical protein